MKYLNKNRSLTLCGQTWMALKEQEAKKELLKFLKLQAEVGAIRDSISRFMKATIKIQHTYKLWQKS